MEENRETLEFDVLFVGGGPANLSGAIHLMKLAQEKGLELEICLIDKAETIGSAFSERRGFGSQSAGGAFSRLL